MVLHTDQIVRGISRCDGLALRLICRLHDFEEVGLLLLAQVVHLEAPQCQVELCVAGLVLVVDSNAIENHLKHIQWLRPTLIGKGDLDRFIYFEGPLSIILCLFFHGFFRFAGVKEGIRGLRKQSRHLHSVCTRVRCLPLGPGRRHQRHVFVGQEHMESVRRLER